MRKLWGALGEGRVRFARLRAIAWVVVGAVSFPLGWANSVALVWIASVYANFASEVAAGEAADDEAVLTELRELRRQVDALRSTLERLAQTRGGQ
jgi:hypothetical protein